MDPSLLGFTILREAADRGIDVGSLTAAMELAAYLHRDDVRNRRKNLPVDPYVTHPFRLVLRLLRYGCADDTVLCAAALHDTVEDHPQDLVALAYSAPGDPLAPPAQGRAIDLLAAAFGPDVARIVAAVTNPPPRTGQTEDERNRDYCAHVERSVADGQVFLVKVADFVDNAGSLHHLADTERRARLEKKYSPLIPLLRSALDQHGSSLRIGEEGLGQIAGHLTAIAQRMAPDQS